MSLEIHIPRSDQDFVESALPGLHIKTLWQSEDPPVSIALLFYEKGTQVPRSHVHASNQFMFCLKGRYRYEPGIVLEPGDFYANPKGNPHGPTEAEEETVLLEIYDGAHYYEIPEYLKDQ